MPKGVAVITASASYCAVAAAALPELKASIQRELAAFTAVIKRSCAAGASELRASFWTILISAATVALVKERARAAAAITDLKYRYPFLASCRYLIYR